MRTTAVLTGGITAAIMVGSAGCGVGGWSQARFERDVEVQFLLPAGSGLAATTSNGSITLAEEARDDVLVRAHIKATTQDRADGVEIVGQTEGGWLEVSAVWPEARKGSEGVSFHIVGPGGRPVRATTSNGAVGISGFAGGATVATSNGSVQIKAHDGPVDARSSNGKITVLGATGEVRADSSNGSLHVELADAGTGPVHLDTSNGGVSLIVGPGFAGSVETDTSNGAIRVSGAGVSSVAGSKTHKTVRIGEGGAASVIDTSNGSITIAVREPAAGSSDE